MMLLQDLIHRLEEGSGMKWFRIALAVLALVMLTVGYNWRAFRNMNTSEAMDTAQLARNISEGRGYSTWCIRPFSMYLLKRHSEEKNAPQQLGVVSDSAKLKENHPDLVNPPVYPLFLAGVMKVLPFRYEIPSKPQPFWSYGGKFWRHQPDFLIGLVNQLLLFGVALMTYLIARRLFDRPVALLSAVLVFGTELLWKFSVSGLSTTLLLLIFMGLTYCLVLLEQQVREPSWPFYKVALLAAAIGLLAGLGALTRYSFAWIILPLLVFVGLFAGQRRFWLLSIVAVVFLGVCTPWVIRNLQVSGTPFGTAGYAIYENTSYFPEYKLQRSLNPDLNKPVLGIFWGKLMNGAREVVTSDLPRLGGTWVTAFFLTGLLIGFRNPAVRRLRYFVAGSLVVLALAQVMGKTQLSAEGNGITGENLLVLLTPLLIIYGVSLFYLLLDQIQFPLLELRYASIGAFGAIACLPMILTFLPPKTIPVSFPPYFPPAIQTLGSWMKPNELTMSDVPWAVAWYGRTPSVFYTLNTQPDFFTINDYMKPINALYLTSVTLDSRFQSQWVKGGDANWGMLILETVVKRQVPTWFPLRKTQDGWMPEHLVLTDRERWSKPQDKTQAEK